MTHPNEGLTGDSRGTRGGLARDSRGTRGTLGGLGLKTHCFSLSFGGTRVRPLTPIIMFKFLHTLNLALEERVHGAACLAFLKF